MMFWNSWVGFYNETYLFLSVCASINLYCYPLFNTAGNAFNSLLSILFGCLLLLFPLYVTVFYNLPSVYPLILKQDEQII